MLSRVSLRAVDLVVTLGMLVLAGLVAYDAVRLGPGWGDSGPAPGFFPFFLSLLMVLGILGAGWEAWRRKGDVRFFEDPRAAAEVGKVGLPILLATAGAGRLGFYVVAAAYSWLFGWWYGRFRWYWTLLHGIVFAVVLYFVFERGFRVALPKSIFYRLGLPF
ncbi:tripartite tricarboxylate transporter TctB family protein [Caldinitratiruptor microaerophilus]|uniref:DUF1468 domain-containing protein n=1 Tax=Caldinitratiruptor microaerophilus TaxID=671077 RepID=A0AA35CM93_9FIRM|nr:tripartite tricarboxylate transporter TctB family protein [Caldinitratiruptor microaerophilus]BDG60973.1 hypothetical protein caldi_20630 [Caldinitratiruptor microaerophilus]